MAEVVEGQLPPGALGGCGPQLLRNFRHPDSPLEELLDAGELGRLELAIKRVSDHLCGLDVRHAIGRKIWMDYDDPGEVQVMVEVRMDRDIRTVRGQLADSIYEIADKTLHDEDWEKIFFFNDTLG